MTTPDPDTNGRPAPPAALVWCWPEAVLGAVYAIPAAIAITTDVSRGLAFAVGVLPAAVMGLPPTRKGRRGTFILGMFVGVPIALGSVLANVPWLAVVSLVALAVGAVLLARRSRVGQIALALGLPMVGVGFSYTDVGEAVVLAALMIVGSLYAAAVSLLWPESPPPPGPAAPPPAPSLDYGIRLGAAGATAAAIGFLLGFDHTGWAPASAMLVMRPSVEMQRLRSVGRPVAVAVGAIAAIVCVNLAPPTPVYCALTVAVVAATAATHRSRWYVTPGFTTFFVFLLLLHANPSDSASRFSERFAETLLGVALAYLFGLAIPAARRRA